MYARCQIVIGFLDLAFSFFFTPSFLPLPTHAMRTHAPRASASALLLMQDHGGYDMFYLVMRRRERREARVRCWLVVIPDWLGHPHQRFAPSILRFWFFLQSPYPLISFLDCRDDARFRPCPFMRIISLASRPGSGLPPASPRPAIYYHSNS